MNAGARFLVYKLPALSYMTLIFLVSSGPITSPSISKAPDYVLHFLAYAALYVAVFWAVHEGLTPARNRGGYWLPAVITILYGISDEYHQSFIPSRDASVLDVGTDALGALAGVPLEKLAARLNLNRVAAFRLGKEARNQKPEARKTEVSG
jgi:VanZ family protein